jgi:hypothetical protein
MFRLRYFGPIIVALTFVFGVAGIALANPSFFANGTSTNNAASTTPAFMGAGTGTSTTPVFDAYAQARSGVTTKADSASLLTQFCASSTATVLNTGVEYSQDGIDWYQNYVLDPSQLAATTSPTYTLVTPFSYSKKFASTSLNGAIQSPANSCVNLAEVIPTPFRFTRVVNSMTGGNGSVWSQLVPVKETP